MMIQNNTFDVNRGFEQKKHDELIYYSSPSLLKLGVSHGFSSRKGGCSESPHTLSSLNLGWHKDDLKENVEKNYRRLAKAGKFEYESIALNNYEHGVNVVVCDVSDCGKGMTGGKFDKCDALISNDPKITMITLHADCVAVYLYDKEENVGSVIHSGWKGTAHGIVINAINKMKDTFRCDKKNIIAAIGPYISQSNYEVDKAVADEFTFSFEKFGNKFIDSCIYSDNIKNKYHLDLGSVIISQMLGMQIPAHNITIADMCTFRDKSNFFSYRRDGKDCGSMGAFLRVL